jgi:hypothetical protein
MYVITDIIIFGEVFVSNAGGGVAQLFDPPSPSG